MSRLSAAIAAANARDLTNAPTPPPHILNRTITKADIDAYPAYFIIGPGRDIAAATDCGHGYWLTDSCPSCD